MNKRVAGIFVFVFLAILAIGFASATVSGVDLTAIKALFGSAWDSYAQGGSEISDGLSKFLLFFLITTVIYLIVSQVVTNRPVMVWIISGVISFLSTVYFVPEQIRALMVSYEALGLTLGLLIPFAILLVLTFLAVRATASNQSGAIFLVILQYLAWIIFGIFVLVRGIMVLFDTKNYDALVAVALLIAFIASLIMIFANGSVRRFFVRQYITEIDDAARAAVDLGARGVITAGEFERGVAGARRRRGA